MLKFGLIDELPTQWPSNPDPDEERILEVAD
jgi:hypothetical protein